METIGMSTTTTSGGEIDLKKGGGGGSGATTTIAASTLVSPSIDSQASEEKQQRHQQLGGEACATADQGITIQKAATGDSSCAGNEGLNGSGQENQATVEKASDQVSRSDNGLTNHSSSETAEESNNYFSLENDTSVTTNRELLLGENGSEQSASLDFTVDNNEADGEKTPVPNFCVEGSGGGDSSVTVVALGSLSTLPGSVLEVDAISSCVTGQVIGLGDLEEDDDVAGSGSAPISVQSSEDMKLSLVSWYSEPEESSRDCCKTNLISRAINKTTSSQQQRAIVTKSDGDSSIHEYNSKSEEKENKTPMRGKGSNSGVGGSGGSPGAIVKLSSMGNQHQAQSQRLRMHVQLYEQNSSAVEIGKVTCSSNNNSHSNGKKMECPRCARRSKSGTTTPAAPSRQPRRVVQSSKSNHELKKPIKSILKSDSRGSGSRSGSGSEKQSSMDSLGSASGIACVMTRSDGGGTRTKFNFNSGSFSSSSISPEDKSTAAKLKRIEKYATLRLKKPRVKPVDFNHDPGAVSDASETGCKDGPCKHSKGVGGPGVNPDIMSKSMSFLEKSTGTPGGATTTLRRQGSLRIRRPSPMWEPSGTRTSALRMQKVQEAKNKTNGPHSYIGKTNSSMNNSGSNHSGSGESIHMQSLHNGYSSMNNSHNSSSSNSGMTNGHSANHHSSSMSQRGGGLNSQKEKHLGAKIFSKLSSAIGQTTSSAMKRIRQERGIQTDPISIVEPLSAPSSTNNTTDGHSSVRISPLPTLLDQTNSGNDEAEQINELESLVHRYRSTALRFQQEFERSEERNRELTKQLQETQSETNEMIDFLQAEKSMLAESLTETENEGKKWQEQVDSVKKEAQSRCSSLVRLSEQHKQEALKSQALLSRLESQSNAIISKQSGEMSETAMNILQTRQRIVAVIEKLLKTYKVPHDLLANAAKSPQIGAQPDDTELNSSLLVPLISALMTGFPKPSLTPGEDKQSPSREKGKETTPSVVTTVTVDNGSCNKPSLAAKANGDSSTPPPALSSGSNEKGGMNLSNSLQNLNQAILEREAAEQLNIDAADMKNNSGTDGLDNIHDGDHLSLKTELDKLNCTLFKLVTVIRIIVVHCDKKVSGVTSNILQCLRSIEDDKVGTIPEMINVQKSLEAWSDSTQCRTTIPGGKICVENGHNGSQ